MRTVWDCAPVASSTAWQSARSWIASPVESNSVSASAPERPGAAPVITRAEVGDALAAHQPRLDGAGQLAAVARLRPLVAEQLEPGDELDLHLSLARAVGAEHVEVRARPQLGRADDGLVARSDAVTMSCATASSRVPASPAELDGEAPAASGSGS